MICAKHEIQKTECQINDAGMLAMELRCPHPECEAEDMADDLVRGAAQDLLAAAIPALAELRLRTTTPDRFVMANLEAAIRKARGE